MQLRWTEPAEKDLDTIAEYYRKEAGDLVAADNVLRIVRNVAALIDMPERTRPGRIPGTRELVFTDLPYLIPYRVKGDEIQILRVFHTARRPPSRW